VSLYLAIQPFVDLIAHTALDIHPPFYYLLLRIWTLLAGNSEFSAAFLSLFFGMILVALVHRLAVGFSTRMAASLALLLAAISPFNVAYSQEIRMYTLGAFLGAASLLSLLKLGRGLWHPRVGFGAAWPWAVYVVGAALGLYTLYYFGFLFLFFNLFFLAGWIIRGRDIKALFWWIGAQAMVAILYSPWAPIALRQALEPPVPPWRELVDLGTAVCDSWSALASGETVDPALIWPFLAALVPVVGAGLVIRRNGSLRPFPPGIALLGFVAVPVATILVMSFWTPLYHPRYVFTFSPAFYVILALGVVRWKRWSLVPSVLVSIAIVGVSAISLYSYHFELEYAPDDHRSATSYVTDRWAPGDAVLINAGYAYPAFLYYFPGEVAWQGRLADYPSARDRVDKHGLILLETGTIDGDEGLGWGNSGSDFYATTEEETARALESVLEDRSRIWVYRIYDTVVDGRGFVRTWLEENGRQFDQYEASGRSQMKVQGYMDEETGSMVSNSAIALNVPLGQRLSLVAYQPLRGGTDADGALTIALYWRTLQPLDGDYLVSLGLYDVLGRPWAQEDRVPVGAMCPPSDWEVGKTVRDVRRLPLPPGTPPGTYTLEVAAYDRSTGEVLEVNDREHGVLGIRVRLDELAIGREDVMQGVPSMKRRADVSFEENLRLLGGSLAEVPAKPGERLQVELAWQALGDSRTDYAATFNLKDGSGEPLTSWTEHPVDGRYPTSQWVQGEVVLDKHGLLLPSDVPGGSYTLTVGATAEDGSAASFPGWLPFWQHTEWVLGEVSVEGRSPSFEVPSDIAYPSGYILGEEAQLLGHDLDGLEVMPGEAVHLTLYWKSLGSTSESYKVFTHMVDSSGRIWTQHDSVPADGLMPTSAWVQDEVITDEHSLEIPQDTPAGEYSLIIGMYEPTTEVRLPVFDENGSPLGDSIMLTTLSVLD
jgi:hypothetical protein